MSLFYVSKHCSSTHRRRHSLSKESHGLFANERSPYCAHIQLVLPIVSVLKLLRGKTLPPVIDDESNDVITNDENACNCRRCNFWGLYHIYFAKSTGAAKSNPLFSEPPTIAWRCSQPFLSLLTPYEYATAAPAPEGTDQISPTMSLSRSRSAEQYPARCHVEE